jgi:hypothetical protein
MCKTEGAGSWERFPPVKVLGECERLREREQGAVPSGERLRLWLASPSVRDRTGFR